MNTSWLAGKSPVLPGTPPGYKQAAKEHRASDQPGASDGIPQWLSWGAYWFVVLLLACTIGWGLLDIACFVALVKWFSSAKKRDRHNQTDKLYQALKQADSFSAYDFANDTLNNPIYSSFPGNVAHEDHTWDDYDWARGHWPDDQDHWH